MKLQRPAQSSLNLDLHSIVAQTFVTQVYYCYTVLVLLRRYTGFTQIRRFKSITQSYSPYVMDSSFMQPHAASDGAGCFAGV
jgi:hypothetical protein